MPKAKKNMTPAQKAAARVPEPVEAPAPEPLAVSGRDAEPKVRAKLPKEERRNRLALLIGGLVLLVALSFALYTCNYSHATDEARAALSSTKQTAVSDESGWIAFGDPAAKTGYAFYPGGKVEAESYAPLMHALADEGLFCVLVKSPFNLAFFDTNAADGVLAAYPQVKEWYVGGHSLGGVAACQWAAENASRVKGVILLASYTSTDLTGTGLRFLDIYGSDDQVMNRDNYAESQALLPADAQTVLLQGGNHAQFGDYGAQEGDGEASISAKEQREQAVAAIVEWIGQAAGARDRAV